jgi:hypothetical protein
MKSTITILATIANLFFTFNVKAQTSQTTNSEKPWGVEFNVVWPFVPGVEIYTAKATRTIWAREKSHGDITFGLLVRPGTRNDENAEKFSEFGLNIGYRHYFWKGLHAELAIYPSFAREVKNKIDGRDYEGFAMTTECYTGYRFDVLKKNIYSLYLMPQAGIGYNVISNLGPQTEANAPFPTLNLQIGINF